MGFYGIVSAIIMVVSVRPYRRKLTLIAQKLLNAVGNFVSTRILRVVPRNTYPSLTPVNQNNHIFSVSSNIGSIKMSNKEAHIDNR